MAKVLLIFLFFSGFSGWADDAPSAEPASKFWSLQSNPDSRFWITGDAGILAGSGFGGFTGLRLRYSLGRCAIAGGWHTQDIHIYDPADVQNSILSLGYECKVLQIGRPKFFRGAHLKAFLMAAYGKSDYYVWEYPANSSDKIDRAGGSTHGFGGSTGAEFMQPLWLGFWVHARVGVEYINFDYHTPDTLGGHEFPGISKTNAFLNIGADFSF